MSSTATDLERNAALIAWYRAHHRALPWRSGRTPYRVLVSETMLQQTQATRVVPFFERFTETYPTVELLAKAPLADVLRLWNGLGYNRRAQRLHAAAQEIAELGWPETIEGLEALPGVGPYTAAAIAAFGFGIQVPAVDTNVKRVLSRWHGEALRGAALRVAATRALDSDAAAWNEAVMDLGATLCRPRAPACDRCPVAAWCAGPEVYEPPPRQARFEGSRRQARGAVIRALARSDATLTDLDRATGRPAIDLQEIVEELEHDGLITSEGDRYRLAE